MFSFIFLFWSLQHVYQYIIDFCICLKNRKTKKEADYEEEIEAHKKYTTESGFNYLSLFVLYVLCIVLNSVIACITYIVVHLPVLESIDDALTHISILGHYSFIFAVFLLIYDLVQRDRGTSGNSFVNKKVLKFWRYLYKEPVQKILDQICIQRRTEHTHWQQHLSTT